MLRLTAIVLLLNVYISNAFIEEDDHSLFNYITDNYRDDYKPFSYKPYTNRYKKLNRFVTKPNQFDRLVDDNTRDIENEVRVTLNGRSDWTYKDQEDWRRFNATCGGRSQSPIDISFPVSRSYRLKLDFQSSSQTRVTLRNTGHTAELSYESGDGDVITARGSALNYDKYVFQQMHFHWGAYDNEGSEHAIFGQKYSAEIHFVFYNSKYRDFSTASNYKDGLTVIALFLQASYEDNYSLKPIIDNLDRIRPANSRTTIKFNLDKLLPKYKDSFYRYSGSLTTPPCSEVVNWIVFGSPLSIGRSQLQKFRELEDSSGNKLKTTWRFLQNRNERLIEMSKLR